MVRAIVGWINGSPPAAQPAPVQEWMKPHPKCDEGCMYHCTKGYTQFPECATTPPAAQPAPALEGRDWSLLEATQESLREHIAEIKRLKAAQPAVPDAIHHTDLNESLEYIQGWNDCRQTMLEMMK